MATPIGIARRLRDALDLEAVPSIGPARRPGRVWLLNPRRLEIVLAAAAYPGVHLRSASRLLMQPLQTLRFHVRQLEFLRLVERRRIRGRIALFIPGLFPRACESFLVAWEDPTSRTILRFLRERANATIDEAANAVGMSPQSVARHVDRLRSTGAVRSTGTKTPRISPSLRWGHFERLCSEGRAGRLDRILALLRQEDLHPSAQDLGEGRYRIEVDGPRARIRFVLPLDPLARAA